MDQLLDPSKYQRIYSIALDKSPWLNTSDTDIDDEGTVSFFVLSNIIYNDDDDDIIGRIIEAYSKIRDANQGRSVHVSVKGSRIIYRHDMGTNVCHCLLLLSCRPTLERYGMP